MIGSAHGTLRITQDFISKEGADAFPDVSHGEGVYIWDRSGKRYFDGSSGAVVSGLGHNNERVKAAMREQADRISFAYGRSWRNSAVRDLSKRIAELAGWELDSSFLVSGGTEGVEAALKLARQVAYARGEVARRKIISRSPSYHGSTLAVLGVTGDPDFGKPFEGMFVDMLKVPAPLSYRMPDGLDAATYARQCAAALEQRILTEGQDNVLCFIMEPVGGTATGALVATDEYYHAVRATCSRYGVFLIFDEVMTGAGRTGPLLAAHHWPQCRPDIVVLAKGLSAGYAPLGAVLTSSVLVDDLRRMGGFMHGHTYCANPQSAAAGCAVLDELVERDLFANAATMGDRLRTRLLEIQRRSSIVGDVRGRGLLCAVEIVADKQTKRMFRPEADAIPTITRLCVEEGLLLISRRTSGGRYGEWLMICPPLICDAGQIDELAHMLERALKRFESAQVSSAESLPSGNLA